MVAKTPPIGMAARPRSCVRSYPDEVSGSAATTCPTDSNHSGGIGNRHYILSMPYSITSAPETAAQLAAHAALLRQCREQIHSIVAAHQWTPLPGSGGEIDIGARANYATPPSVSVNEVVATYLDMAGHHCAALAALCSSHEILMSGDMLVRAVVECCARAAWVQSGATPEKRLARAYLEEDLSNEEQKKVAGRLWRENSPYSARATDRFKRVRTEIKNNFANDHDLNGRVIHAEKQASPSEAVRQFFALAESNGAVGFSGRKQKEGYYDLLSNGTHPTLYRLRELRRWGEVGTGQIRRTTLVMDPGFLSSLTQLAVLAIYNSLSLTYRYNGWPFDPEGSFAQEIGKALPNLLR